MGIEGINPNIFNSFSIDTSGIDRASLSRKPSQIDSDDKAGGSFSKVEGDVAEISEEATQSFFSLNAANSVSSSSSSARADKIKSLKSLIDNGQYFNQVDSFSVAGSPGLIEAVLG